MNQKIYLSVEDVAKQFGLNTTTVYRLAQRGALPGFKVGGQWRFQRVDIDHWIEQQKANARDEGER